MIVTKVQMCCGLYCCINVHYIASSMSVAYPVQNTGAVVIYHGEAISRYGTKIKEID
jgi:hypothetical protein